jgi:transposase-like protein
MIDKKYREYTDEFKRETPELLKNSKKSASQLERELGITPGLLLKWRHRYQVVSSENQAPRLAPSDLEAAKREIQRLERELAEVAEEREILHLPWRAVPGKKVVNIFSRKGE